MTDSFLDNAGGWTPAPDVLARKYGFESAYLWGRLRRLCQLGGGTYTISPEALGKRFGMSRRTVIDRLKAMIRDGYVDDLTPGVRNKAHTYSVKKGEDKILSGMQISHTDIETIPQDDELGTDMGMRILHSDDAEIAHLDDTGMQDLPKRYAKNAYPGMQNLHLNRDSSKKHLKETKEERETPAPAQKETNLQKLKRIGEVDFLAQNRPFAVKLSETCGNPGPEYVTNGDRRKLAEATAQLLDWDATVDQLTDFRQKWKFDDDPWLSQVVGQWGRYLTAKKRPQKESPNGIYSKPNQKFTGETGESLADKPTHDPNTDEIVFPDGHREPANSSP